MKKILIGFIIGIGFIVTMFVVGVSYFFLTLPNVDQMKGCMTTELYKVSLCPGEAGYVPLRDISSYLKWAIIQSEDASFYHHKGFDLDEIKNSIEKNLERKKFARGGSTITQQLAKNVFLTNEKSLLRKAKEAILTMRIEERFKKDEIFERYLNVVQFGKDLFGISAASQFYFHKAPSQLNILESAFLTMLLPSPEKYSTSFHKGALSKFAGQRIRTIVSRLNATKRISDEEMNQALQDMTQFPWGYNVQNNPPDSEIQSPGPEEQDGSEDEYY